MEMSATRRV